MNSFIQTIQLTSQSTIQAPAYSVARWVQPPSIAFPHFRMLPFNVPLHIIPTNTHTFATLTATLILPCQSWLKLNWWVHFTVRSAIQLLQKNPQIYGIRDTGTKRWLEGRVNLYNTTLFTRPETNKRVERPIAPVRSYVRWAIQTNVY